MKKWLSYLLLFGLLFFCLYRCTEILREPRGKKIFIIGASTVRYDYDPARMGWGDALIQYYMKHPKDGFNEARRGASTLSYHKMDEVIKKQKGEAYWQRTKGLIASTAEVEGSYLLIQFGANDKAQKLTKNQFQKALKEYVTEAHKLGVIPVLISPVETRLKIKGKPYHSRGRYPEYMRELAYQERVLFLDLNRKSYDEFARYTQAELDQMFGAVVFSNGRVDRTHFAPKGAKIVAGWVRDLACEKDRGLCSLF